HSMFHQKVSGLAVGFACFFWIRAEIDYYRTRKPWTLLVWAGRWSYSLYLIHFLVIGVDVGVGLLAQNSVLDWLIEFSLALAWSYVFSLASENPSPTLARKIPLCAKERAESPPEGFLAIRPAGEA